MGISDELPAASRDALHAAISALMEDADALPSRLDALLAPDCVWHVARPVGDLRSAARIAENWLLPLRRALGGFMRRGEIAMGGLSHTGSGAWIAWLGHYVGMLDAPLLGVAPHGKLVFLRCGEFYRVEEGRVVEAFILPDVLDLMRQAGRMPVPAMLGTEMLFPGPATHDGMLPAHPDRSASSLALVEAMLFDLHSFEPASFESAGQTGYWHPDMLWYGPGGIGANVTYPGFQRDHRIPMLTAFPDRKGGNHFARFGDGDYVCSGGWPSMTMTHTGPYLGVAPTGRALTLRVMDFWRVQHGTIRENWVLLDLLELFAQMGVDLIAG